MSKSFKGSMANYYHEARAQVKKIKTIQEENKKRAERRAELTAPVAPDPLQQLSVMGTACQLLKGGEAHAANEAGDNLMPWNGQLDNMIDRFDVRSLLDFYREPDAAVLAARQKSSEELKLEESLQFERYRDLVRLMARGLTEERGLAVVEQEGLERRAAQHAALQAANDAVYCNDAKQQQQQQQAMQLRGVAGTGTAAGTGMYSAIGFSYDATGAPVAAGTPGAAATAVSDSSDSDSDDSDSDEEGGGAAAPVSAAELAQEAEDERVDEMAEAFGLSDFVYRLHRAAEKEGSEEAALRTRPKKRYSRKKAAQRARRMAGMGLNPATGLAWACHDPYADPRSLVNPWQPDTSGRERQRAASPDRPLHRRGSPSYEAGGWRARDRSDSPRPGARQYITEFVATDGGTGGPGASGRQGSGSHGGGGGGIIDALPDRPDPAMLGGIQPVSRDAFAVQGVKRDDLHRQLRQAADDDEPPSHRARSRSRNRSRDRGRDRSRSRQRHCSSRRSGRSRSHSRSRSRSADRYRRGRRYASKSRSRSRSRDKHKSSRRRSWSRSRSRSRSPHRERRSDTGSKYGSSGSRGAPAPPAAARAAGGSASKSAGATGGRGSAAASAAAKGPAAAAAAPKETPQERLKRLMQAQLNKAAQKDSLAVAQKKIQAEKDKVARAQIERVALAAGRGRDRDWGDRSPSPRSRSPPGR